jgi:hypothetical protein
MVDPRIHAGGVRRQVDPGVELCHDHGAIHIALEKVGQYRTAQTLEEVQITLAALRADRAYRQGLRDIEAEQHLRIIGKQFAHDIGGMLVLEQIAVAAAIQKGQPRFQRQAVTCQSTVGSRPARLSAEAMPGAAADRKKRPLWAIIEWHCGFGVFLLIFYK